MMRNQRFWLGCLSLILTCWIGSAVHPALSQTPAVPTLPSPLRQLEDNLPTLTNFLDSNNSDITRGTVRLDGRRLFTIAVPVLQDEANDEQQQPVESRVQIIQDRLQEIVDRGFDPSSLEVVLEIDSNSRQPVIYVRYERDGETIQNELITITSLDADLNGSNIDDWAETVRSRIESALLTAQSERQPESLQQRAFWAAGILLGVGIVSLALTRWQQQLRRDRHQLTSQSQTTATAISSLDSTIESPESTTALFQQRAANQQKRRINDIKWRLSQLGQLLTWSIGLFIIAGLFPQTRWLQALGMEWVQIPIRLLLIILLTYLAIRLSEMVVDRLFWALQSSTSLASNTSQRLMLRFTTFSQVAKSIMVLIWGTVGLLSVISMLGVEINPALLTVAGIVGVGISLASQNVIKDVINGFLILLEDQYGVGDVVTIGEASGFVENMNLRITQLRSTEGHLITIPNSAIAVVQNLSKEWSRVDLRVNVAYEADLDQALAVTEQVAQAMSQDAEWQDLILETPQLLGVDNLDYAGATIRLWIKTQPLRQWEVAREYRRRLKLAFDRAGIRIGIPQQSLLLNSPPPAIDRSPKPNSQSPSGKS